MEDGGEDYSDLETSNSSLWQPTALYSVTA